MISEVAYDTVDESGASSEYIEIYNPTGSAISLTQYLVSDSAGSYFRLVEGAPVAMTAEVIMQFPSGTSIPAGGFVVVCDNANSFLGEFFGGDLAAFTGQAGAPQLFERPSTTADNTSVSNMVLQSSNNIFSLGNASASTGDGVILFRWNGSSDRVEDVDVVAWSNADQVPDKTGIAVDGPDADTTATSYAQDFGSTALGGTTTANTHSLQRRTREEFGELPSGGNGLGGHDETSEEWNGWVNAAATPGTCWMETFYPDADSDGFGAATGTKQACTFVDQPGFVTVGGDCNDGDNSIRPGGTETCDGVDQDCDGAIDDDAGPTWYRDADDDTFGDPDDARQQCTQPNGYVANAEDCNDTAAIDSPTGTEICDGRDNDCDGDQDENVMGLFFADADNDGFGREGGVQACSAPPGHVENALDCDDSRNDVHPDTREVVCRDQADNDCDEATDAEDADCEGVTDPRPTGCSCTHAAGVLPLFALVAAAVLARRVARP